MASTGALRRGHPMNNNMTVRKFTACGLVSRVPRPAGTLQESTGVQVTLSLCNGPPVRLPVQYTFTPVLLTLDSGLRYWFLIIWRNKINSNT